MTPQTQELILQEQRRILRGLPGGPGTPGVVQTIQPGAGVSIDNTDPANPVVSATAAAVALTTANIVPAIPPGEGPFYPPNADHFQGVAVGSGAASVGPGAVAVGTAAFADGSRAAAFGEGARASGHLSLAVGPLSAATAEFSVALGAQARAIHLSSVALGDSARTDAINQVSVGEAPTQGLPEVTRRVSHVSDPEADTDAANKRWVLANAGGGGGNPNQIVRAFNLAGTTPVEVLRIPCPPGMGWQFSLALGVGDINSTPTQLFAAVPNSFFNEAGTFVYDGDWVSRWPVEAPAPIRFSTLDLTADPVIDGTFMRAAQLGNELVITCEPDNALAIGPCAILFEGTRSDGSGFAPSAPAPVAALDTLAVASLTTPFNIPNNPAAGSIQVPLDTADENAGGHFSAGSGFYTAPATGFYLITASAGLTNSTDNFIEVRRNAEVLHAVIEPGASDSPNGNFTFLARLTAGDQVGLFIRWPFLTASATVLGIEGGKGSTGLNIVQLVDSAAGALPDDAAKMLATLQVGMPNWFKAPDLANSGLDVFASAGRNVAVSLWMLQPWTSATVFWGDGQQSTIVLDGNNNPRPQGGPGSVGFSSVSGVNHTYAADGTYVMQLVVQNAYGQDIHEETFVFEPV